MGVIQFISRANKIFLEIYLLKTSDLKYFPLNLDRKQKIRIKTIRKTIKKEQGFLNSIRE